MYVNTFRNYFAWEKIYILYMGVLKFLSRVVGNGWAARFRR